MKKILFSILITLIIIIPSKVLALNEVNIYFFHSDNCSLCSQEKAYLQALKNRYPNMRIYSYEINTDDNYLIMDKAKKLYNISTGGVPFTVVGDKAYIGFSQDKKALFQKYVYTYSINPYENILGKELGINYKNDLEGTVQEYNKNEDYTIEESSGIVHETTYITHTDKRYTSSVILIVSGTILGIICIYLYFKNRSPF